MTVRAPEPDCWLHPAAEVRTSTIAGRGLFAREPIRAGTRVSRLGGRLVTGRDLRALIDDPATGYVDTITAGPDLHLVLAPRRPNGYGNHSCDPNLWWTGPYTLSARRDIARGEELTNDYATSTAEPTFHMSCTCASPLCRGTITGNDWQRPDLRTRYGPHWIPAIQALFQP